MIVQISIFDEEKNICLSRIRIPGLGPEFELKDEDNRYNYFTENQLISLKEMIDEMLQTINKRDY